MLIYVYLGIGPQPRPFYKPFITKTAVLVALLLFTVTLIVLTEIGCRQIPNHPGIEILGYKATNAFLKSLNATTLLPRQKSKLKGIAILYCTSSLIVMLEIC